MEQVIPWPRPMALIEAVYPNAVARVIEDSKPIGARMVLNDIELLQAIAVGAAK